MRFLLFFLLLFNHLNVFSQVGINTSSPQSSSALDVSSTTKGVLIPRMTNTQMNAITSPATGLTIFNTDASALYQFNGSHWCSREDRISKRVDDGVAIQLDNLKVRLSTNNNNRSLELCTVSGTINISGSSFNAYPTTSVSTGGVGGSISGWVRQTNQLTTSFTPFEGSMNFLWHSAIQNIEIMDETNNHAYSLFLFVGSSFKGNFLSIKRIY
jgi:hypothetical protein